MPEPLEESLFIVALIEPFMLLLPLCIEESVPELFIELFPEFVFELPGRVVSEPQVLVPDVLFIESEPLVEPELFIEPELFAVPELLDELLLADPLVPVSFVPEVVDWLLFELLLSLAELEVVSEPEWVPETLL